MKIVVLSDTHGDHLKLKNIPDGDVLIHAGDFTRYGVSKEVFKFNKWLGTLPHRHKILIAGNHDRCMERQSSHVYITNAHYLQDSLVDLEGIKFYGSPYTPIFLNWAFMEDEIGLEQRWARIPQDIDVLITHGPLKNMMDYVDNDYNSSRNVGSTSLREWVLKNKPKYHVCGHIHSGHGGGKLGETTCINASVLNEEYEIAYEPMVFNL